MSFPAIGRRRALLWLSALGVSVGLHGVARGRSCASFASDLDLDAVRDLGREYLLAHPDDPEVGDVESLLGVAATTELQQVRQLRERMQEDFSADRLVQLSGWFVSVTEGRVFAALSRC
jgi:hypothetical protein